MLFFFAILRHMTKVLWLASWYPSPADPVLGDFIQRHADAVSRFVPVHVIHVVQQGPAVHQKEEIDIRKDREGVQEHIVIFPFKPIGLALLDKIRYQIKYLRHFKMLIGKYIKENGKPELIHVHVPVKAGLIALHFLKTQRIPFIVSDHSSHYEKEAVDSFYRRNYYFRNNTRKILRAASAATNVSTKTAEIVRKLFDLPRVETIHNVVDTSLFFFSEGQWAPGNRFRFLHVSSLAPQKNLTGIFDSLVLLKEKNDNWELVICGPRPERYYRLAKEKGLHDNVIFKGEIPYKDVATEMKASNALVLFSHHENFPCVVIEALCCGLPVITSNAGGVAEAINNENGIIVEKNDQVGLSNAMDFVMRQYEKYDRQSISKEATSRYHYDNIGKQFAGLYEMVLNRRK